MILLSTNAINSIDDHCFSCVPSVTYINLCWNQLSIIRKLTFAGLPNLSDLILYSNQIHTVETGAFYDNTALTYLYLTGNNLETIPECVFDPDNHPAALNNFRIYFNPLRCDSKLCWIKYAEGSWITVTSPGSIDCAGPGGLAGSTWDAITTTDLGCSSPGE